MLATDLGLVQSKIEHLEYDRLKDFSADVTQIFENARTYNAKDSAIYQCADILEQRFREHLLQVKEQIEGRNRELNRVCVLSCFASEARQGSIGGGQQASFLCSDRRSQFIRSKRACFTFISLLIRVGFSELAINR